MQDFIALQIPREVLHAARMTPQQLQVELAVSLFQQGKLSFGKARQMAGLSFWVFQQLLGSRSIPVQYADDELEADLAALQELNRQ
jgi:predicted HTH domain antitoxin